MKLGLNSDRIAEYGIIGSFWRLESQTSKRKEKSKEDNSESKELVREKKATEEYSMFSDPGYLSQ